MSRLLRLISISVLAISSHTLPLAAQSLVPGTTQRPSFDCSKARSASARLICADGELAGLDGQLAIPFRGRLDKLSGAERDAFIEEQRRWINERNERCGLKGRDKEPTERLVFAKKCMADSLRARTSELGRSPSASSTSSDNPGYPFQLADRNPAAMGALEKIIPERLKSVQWIYELKGVAEEMKVFTFDGKSYLNGSVCKPHDCGDNHFAFLVAVDGSRATAAIKSDDVSDGKVEFLGDPAPHEISIFSGRFGSLAALRDDRPAAVAKKKKKLKQSPEQQQSELPQQTTQHAAAQNQTELTYNYDSWIKVCRVPGQCTLTRDALKNGILQARFSIGMSSTGAFTKVVVLSPLMFRAVKFDNIILEHKNNSLSKNVRVSNSGCQSFCVADFASDSQFLSALTTADAVIVLASDAAGNHFRFRFPLIGLSEVVRGPAADERKIQLRLARMNPASALKDSLRPQTFNPSAPQRPTAQEQAATQNAATDSPGDARAAYYQRVTGHHYCRIQDVSYDASTIMIGVLGRLESVDRIILLDDSKVHQLFQYVYTDVQKACAAELKAPPPPRMKIAFVNAYYFEDAIRSFNIFREWSSMVAQADSYRITGESFDGKNWKIFNGPGSQMREQAAQNAAADQLARQQALERQRIDDSRRALRAKFINDFSVQQFINEEMLTTNPFVYKDQVIGVHTAFMQMLSANEAVFSFAGGIRGMLVTGVQSSRFTSVVHGVLAIRVRGTKPFKTPWGEALFPYGEFVGMFECKSMSCNEFYDERR